MRIAYTGNGFLGKKLHERFGYTYLDCDILHPPSILSAVLDADPDMIIHTAAMTSVDQCEKNTRDSFNVNVRGVSNILNEFWKKDRILIYLSTDHVFSGEHWFGGGYKEVHKPSPVNKYGFTKWAGEVMLNSATCQTLVIRCSKMFDHNTLKPDLEVLQSGTPMEFTSLIKRSFVHVDHFLTGLEWVINNFDVVRSETDVLHLAGKSVCSFYDFWLMAAATFGISQELIVNRNTKLSGVTPRPFRAGLDVGLAKRLGVPLFDTVDGLKMIKEKGI